MATTKKQAAAAPTKRVRNHKSSGTQIPHAERRGVKVDLYLTDEMAAALDAARGDTSRSAWIRAAIQGALDR